jgi:flagellin-specific chaperone FliS
MDTLKDLETKAIIEMGKTIDRQQKIIEELQSQVRHLESQVYGGTTQ